MNLVAFFTLLECPQTKKRKKSFSFFFFFFGATDKNWSVDFFLHWEKDFRHNSKTYSALLCFLGTRQPYEASCVHFIPARISNMDKLIKVWITAKLCKLELKHPAIMNTNGNVSQQILITTINESRDLYNMKMEHTRHQIRGWGHSEREWQFYALIYDPVSKGVDCLTPN